MEIGSETVTKTIEYHLTEDEFREKFPIAGRIEKMEAVQLTNDETGKNERFIFITTKMVK